MLFGVTILAKLQLAALKRAEKKQADRKAFYLYVDEFQNFATLSFTQMLSEARKYKVFLTMAEQSTQQQDDQKMVNIILANVGTVIVFRTGSPKDEELLLPLFEPYIEKGEISNLSAYNFYFACRITSVDERQEPMSGYETGHSYAQRRSLGIFVR
jgi:type IV secretory pathway VirB4 component